MIILDTNVVSELMRPAPESRVLRWCASQAAEDLHITAVTMAEILYGIELAATGAATCCERAQKRCSKACLGTAS